MRLQDKVAIVILILLCYGGIFYKIKTLGHSASRLLPERFYELTMDIKFDGHEEPVKLKAALPVSTERQIVRQEFFGAPDFPFQIKQGQNNRWGIWEKENVNGPQHLVYSSTVRTQLRQYQLPETIAIPETYPLAIQPYLLATKNIQMNDHEIENIFNQLIPLDERNNAIAIVRRAYAFTTQEIKAVTLKGTTDALTCLRLKEASCGGKSRLFAALCRVGKVPVRLVGGLILKNGTWRSTHIWTEAWLAGHWVPFGILNEHYASVPDNYLTLYYGDFSLFSHTRDINFDYFFHGKSILAPKHETGIVKQNAFGNLINLWSVFERIRIPLNLLKIILMIPFGALAVVLLRNIVGVETFGTFMPALLAVAFRDTGIWWGLILFVAILIMGSLVRLGLERFQLLHTPRLAIIMTVTVFFMMLITVLGVTFNLVLPTRISLFPIVILTLTVERAAIITEEEGIGATVQIALGTMVVVLAAFFVMNWETLQIIVVTFPESLLMVVAVFILLGRWNGMRLNEYIRFRTFLMEKSRTND